MKQKFSTAWRASKQPRKQRKYQANAPLHLKKKLLSVNLSKDLRKKHSKRNTPVKKGDVVKILRGKFKKKQGKVLEIKIKVAKIFVENIQVKKQDGSKVNIPLKASNLQIIELNLEDKKRRNKLGLKEQVNEKKTEKAKEDDLKSTDNLKGTSKKETTKKEDSTKKTEEKK